MIADQLARKTVYACHDGVFRELVRISGPRALYRRVGSEQIQTSQVDRFARLAVRALHPGFAKAFLREMAA